MIHKLRQQNTLKRATRWLLVLFVVSWTNLVFQAPLHAAMKFDRMLSEDTGVMNCHCPPPICDTVLSYASDRSIDGVQHINLDLLAFNGMVVSVIRFNPIINNVKNNLGFLELEFRETSPPPLLLKTVLLI